MQRTGTRGSVHRRARPWRFAAALALLHGAPAPALDPGLAITQYSHRAWRADQAEGSLPQNSVFSILQTRDGYLWLATQEGLVRFDGVRFVEFNSRNTEAIRHNDVWKLLEDRDGGLWIGTRGGGLTRYHAGTFTNYSKDQGLSNASVQALWQDADGALWIGTRGGGLNRFKDGKFSVFTTKDGLSNDTVYALHGDRAGNLWIGTDGGGLNRYRDGRFTAYGSKQGLSNDTVYAIHEDRAGSLWVGTGAGLNRLRDGKLTVFRARDGLSNDNIRSIHEDRDGNLWIGTDGGGLNRYTEGRFTALTTRHGLSNDNIGALFEDREGSLWIGTDAGGLNRLKDNKFVGFTTVEGLANDNARAILEDRDGALWIGTFGGLSRYRDGRYTAFTTKQGLSSDVVLSLAQSRNGDIWAGTLGGGLNRLRDGRITQFGKAEGLSNETVLSLLEDSTGTLWAGTRSGGLNRFDGNRFRAYTTADGLPINDVRYILEAKDGGLWLGTLGGGVVRFKDGKFTAYGKAQGLSHDLVLALHEEADGTLWIGTFGGGLNRYRDGRFTAYTTKQGMLDDVVFQILDDGHGNLWMSSNRGVSRVSKQELHEFAEGRRAAVSHVAYGVSEGMRSAECNGAHQPAGWRTRDGRLWFPTIHGVARVDPAALPVNALKPPVRVEELWVNDQQVPLDDGLELPPGRTKLEFRYTALSFLAPEQVQFRVKLEGFDEDWVGMGTRRTAHYTNVPPGRYRFVVTASNNDGVWNDAGAALAFRLRPPFWRHPLFYAVYVLALALAVALIVRFHRRRVDELQAREHELLTLIRERQAAHDALKAAHKSLEERVADLARVQGARQGVVPIRAVDTQERRRAADREADDTRQLVGDFNRTLAQLAEREHEVQAARDALAVEVREKTRANQDLEQALQQLRIAQAQLVQSEKLASLGSLVAGVAHEINTPVGVSVTAASTLQDWTVALEQQHREGKLTRGELDRFVALAAESTEILLKNLRRAADLIHSFKQVAVDQASGERRCFKLKAYLDEILLSLAPKLNRTPHQVVVECPADVQMDSYPGALAQIVTNLVSNSLAHGFPEGRVGRITIAAHPEGGWITLRYADDGIGIPPEHLPKIYDPFFTTKRGAGGSGLGLHIVYNLVTQLLGGGIQASSTPGLGTTFELRFPAEVRKAAAA